MKSFNYILLLALTVVSFRNEAPNKFRNGDIIFQTSESSQSTAVALATHSKFTHCGIIFSKGNEYFVYEAIGPVVYTPLKTWLSNCRKGQYLVKRLKNSDQTMTAEVISKMKEAGNKYKGKEYDLYFGWNDDLIYCSELVWKIYKNGAGMEVGKLQKIKDLDLSSGPVKAKLKERYGDKIPMDEIVISPQSISESNLLETVVDTY